LPVRAGLTQAFAVMQSSHFHPLTAFRFPFGLQELQCSQNRFPKCRKTPVASAFFLSESMRLPENMSNLVAAPCPTSPRLCGILYPMIFLRAVCDG
jgi:hypothetical protein